MAKIRLQSALGGKTRDGYVPLGVNVPGILQWAKQAYGKRGRKNDRMLVATLADSFRLRPEIILAILTVEVNTVIEGEDVVFQWPNDDIYANKKRGLR